MVIYYNYFVNKIEKSTSKNVDERSQKNLNNVSIVKGNLKNENLKEQENTQNNKNERVIRQKNDASNNILKDLGKKQANLSQNNIENDIDDLNSYLENKDKKPVSRNYEVDIQNKNTNNISFAEDHKADLKLNDDLIKSKLINNFNKKNNSNNIINNNPHHHYKTVNIVKNKNNINEISVEVQNYQNTDYSKNNDNSSYLNTNSVNHTNPNTNTLQQSNPNIQLHNKNQIFKNSKYNSEDMNNNLVISHFIHNNPIENKNQPGYTLNENNKYQSTLIPINQQQPLVVVINNTILSDNKKDEELKNIKNNLTQNNHDMSDKKRNLPQNKIYSNEEGLNDKANNYFISSSENDSNNIKINTYLNNVSVSKENNCNMRNNKISYNFGIFEKPKKITLNSNFKNNSNNNQERNKNTLLTNYNNFITSNKNKNSIANNSNIPSTNSKINPSFFNSSLNQSLFNNKDQSQDASYNKNSNVNNLINNAKKPKNIENFNNYILNESLKIGIFKNHFQEKNLNNEQNKSKEKKNYQSNIQDNSNKLLFNNNSNNTKLTNENDLLSSNKFSNKQKIPNLSLKISEIIKDKDTKTINIDLNNKNLISNKADITRLNKYEKTNGKIPHPELNFPNHPNFIKENKNISINEKANDNHPTATNNELIITKNPKLNLRTTFFSQLKNNENNLKKTNKYKNIPNSYMSTLNDKDEKQRVPNNLTNTISKITENYYSNNLKQISNQEPKSKGTPIDLKTKNINYNENMNSLFEKNHSAITDSSLSKNKTSNIYKEKDVTNINNKLNFNNLLTSLNKSVNVTETNSSQFLKSKMDKSKLSFAAKNTNLNSLKFGLNNNILSTTSKINLKKNILTASATSKNNNLSNMKYSQNYVNNISSNTKIVNENTKNGIFLNLNQSKNSIINMKEATASKNLLNQSRNQISGLNNRYKNSTTMNNNINESGNHLKLTKDLASNENNKRKFNMVFNNIQSGVIDLNAPNKTGNYENPNSNDSSPNLIINNKFSKKSNGNNMNNISINGNQYVNNLTNNSSNINHYFTNPNNNNSRLNGLKSEYYIETGNSKNKFTDVSNHSYLNQRTISENTDNSQNTIINNKFANNGIFKSVNTFISNESGVRSESMNYSNLDSRGNSRSKSKASDKTTSTIFYYNNNGYKSDASEQNLNFHKFNSNIKSGDESDNTNSAIYLKNFNKNSFNFNELKKKLQIKDLDNSNSFHNSSLNRSGNNNTIKEGNSLADNLDCKIIDIKEDYDQNNHSGNFNNFNNINNKTNSGANNNKYSIKSINHNSTNNKKSVIELNKEDLMKKNFMNQNRNIEFMRNKIK